MERLKFWLEFLNLLFDLLSHLFFTGKEMIEWYNNYSPKKAKKGKKGKK